VQIKSYERGDGAKLSVTSDNFSVDIIYNNNNNNNNNNNFKEICKIVTLIRFLVLEMYTIKVKVSRDRPR